MLPQDIFFNIVKYTPLIALDIIFYSPQGEILVGLRANRPAQNYWFVPGGRIYKDETIEMAFNRIIKSELALDLNYSIAQFKGVFQHIYDDNMSGISGFGTHYVVLAHEIKLSENLILTPGDLQHRMYKWVKKDQLLADPQVHLNTKYYFIEANLNKRGYVFSCTPPDFLG